MNDHLNIARLKTIATILADFSEEIVFVGGATVSLYASRPELTSIRVTDDVDVVIELISTGEFYKLESKLITLGFKHDRHAPIISRYLYQGIKVDFMPTDPSILGFTNRWYKEGIRQKMKVVLEKTISIHIFSAPYFLASKMEAFHGRGKGDLYASHDLEDIIYILDHRPTIKTEILTSPETVKHYLAAELAKLADHPFFPEALLGHVEQQDAMQRVQKITTLLKDLKNGSPP